MIYRSIATERKWLRKSNQFFMIKSWSLDLPLMTREGQRIETKHLVLVSSQTKESHSIPTFCPFPWQLSTFWQEAAIGFHLLTLQLAFRKISLRFYILEHFVIHILQVAFSALCFRELCINWLCCLWNNRWFDFWCNWRNDFQLS